MALKRLKVKLAAQPATKSGDIPVILIEGDLIKQYNTADKQVKDGEKLMKDLRSEVLEIGLENESGLYSRNIADAAHPITTVKLQDDEGEVVQVQFQNKYGVVPDLEAAEEFFADAKRLTGKPVDINDFMQETVVAKFDCGVFLDAQGKFQQAIYDKFRTAIEKVATQLAVACPLESKKVVAPLPVLHEKRWAVFPVIEAQKRLTQLCPSTIAIKPVRANGDK